MKISCLQENLNKGLTIVSRFISSKTQLPILENILLVTDQGQLRLSATNLEAGINLWFLGKVEKEGQVAIPAKSFSEFITSLPPEKITLELEENLLKVSAGAFWATFNVALATDFPPVPGFSGEPLFIFSGEELSEALSLVTFAASQDEGRPALTGVYFLWEKEKILLVATDGYRLSLKNLKPKKPEKNEGGNNFVLPARSLTEVGRLLSEIKKAEEVKMTLLSEGNQAIFSFGDCEVAIRQIEGQFPDFQKILPQEVTTKLILEKEALLKAVRLASIFARDTSNIIKWKIGKDNLTISANSPQVGENYSVVEAQVSGEENEIAFNYRYLLDLLGAFSAKEIIFEMTGPLNPGVFKPPNDASFLHLIMPVRIQE